MTTKTRESKKSTAKSSNDKPRKKARSKARGGGKSSEPSAGRIEKGIEERLSRIEGKLDRRKRSTARAVEDKEIDPVEVESGEESPVVEVKRVSRRRAASRRRKVHADMDVDIDEDVDEDVDYEDMDGMDRERSRTAIDRILSFLPGSRAREYESIIDKLDRMDEFGKAPDLDKRLEAFMLFLYEKYWRVETLGLENIPDEGRTLIVSNHSGVLPFDGAMMATAILKFHPAERYARFLIEDWFGQLPFATEFMNAVGQVRACQENAERLLRQEQLVGVFPEGIKGMSKGFKDRYNLARFGRGGVIRLAIRTRTPVVPCAVVGAEEIYIVLGYANWLGKMFGMPLFPISARFPWLGPLGLIPLPTKWFIQFGEMISYDEYDDSALKDNVIINRLNRQLRATIQQMLDSMLKKRRSLFF